MARQNGRTTVHFDPGAESDDFTMCGKCMRNPRWQLAFREAKAATRR